MLTSEIRSRVEPELKDEAQAVLGRVGLNISDAIRLFLRQVVAAVAPARLEIHRPTLEDVFIDIVSRSKEPG